MTPAEQAFSNSNESTGTAHDAMRCDPMGERELLKYVHNADVHIFIGALLKEDLLAGATFFGCGEGAGKVGATRRMSKY
jgi:hypothetical protein